MGRALAKMKHIPGCLLVEEKIIGRVKYKVFKDLVAKRANHPGLFMSLGNDVSDYYDDLETLYKDCRAGKINWTTINER